MRSVAVKRRPPPRLPLNIGEPPELREGRAALARGRRPKGGRRARADAVFRPTGVIFPPRRRRRPLVAADPGPEVEAR
jgi:hypothetical protein